MIIGILACVVGLIMWSRVNRGKKPDPMAGRLVHSTEEQQAALYAWRKEQHDTFDARHTVNFFRTQPAKEAAPFAPRYPKMSNLMWYAPPGTVNLETGEWL
jgi:hypothetical protein